MLQMYKWSEGSVWFPSKHRRSQKKKLREAEEAVRGVLSSLVDYQDPAAIGPISENKIAEQDAYKDFHDLTSKHDHRPSALQHVHEVCRKYDLMIRYDVRSVRQLIYDALMNLASSEEDRRLLADQKKNLAAKKAE